MFKLLTIALLLAPVPAMAGEFERILEEGTRQHEQRMRDFWNDVHEGNARADRLGAEAEADRRAIEQQRALDSINMQMFQMRR